MPLLEVKGLTVIYPERSVTAVEGVSFTVSGSEFVSLLGPSGCGKSSIINAVAGFLAPAAGEILLEDAPVDGPGLERGVVFQDRALFPWMTVEKNLRFGLHSRGIHNREQVRKTREILEVVGLGEWGSAYPHQLSGGMKQRVAIARALVVEPKLLLMDEPFGALDSPTRSRLHQFLLELWRAQRITILFVTHNVDEAIFLSNRLLILSSRPGRVSAEIEINLPPLRTPELIGSLQFAHLKARVLSILEQVSSTDIRS